MIYAVSQTYGFFTGGILKVEYVVTGTLSSEHTASTIVHSRRLSNIRRLQVASEVSRESTAKYYYEQFPSSENTELALSYGNYNKIQSKGVLRRAKFDILVRYWVYD